MLILQQIYITLATSKENKLSRYSEMLNSPLLHTVGGIRNEQEYFELYPPTYHDLDSVCQMIEMLIVMQN